MSEIDKLRNLISKNESRIGEIGRSIQKAQEAFSSEAHKVLEAATLVSTELDQWDKKIAGHDDTIKGLEKRKQDLRSETKDLEQESKDAEKRRSSAASEASSIQKEIAKAQESLKQYQQKIDKLKTDLDGLNKEAADLRGSLETAKQSSEKEISTLENTLAEFQQKSKELAEKEPITEFLLTEAESEPPEVAVIAGLVQENGETTIAEIKKMSKANWGTLSKAIDALEAKGVVSKVDKDNLKLLKK